MVAPRIGLKLLGRTAISRIRNGGLRGIARRLRDRIQHGDQVVAVRRVVTHLRADHDAVRIIHGRGVGVQRKTVRTLLERDERVRDFGDAPPGAGGWGATWAELE